MLGDNRSYKPMIVALVGFLCHGAVLNAQGSILGQRLDAIRPGLRNAIQPEIPVLKATTQTLDFPDSNMPDWLDVPLCHPDSPVPEENENPTTDEYGSASETQGMNPLLPPTGTAPSGGGGTGRSFGASGSGASFAGGGGGAGGGAGGSGFTGFTPTDSPISPTGGNPVKVIDTGGPVSPEPASMVLLGSGMLGVIAVARRKRR